MNNYICYVAGHSGGHIIPSATQALREIEKNKNTKILFFSTNSKLDRQILDNYNFKKIFLPVTNIPKRPLALFKFIFLSSITFFKSLYYLFKIKPAKVVSMGGVVSIPICLAAKLLKIPIELWELNLEPGKTINFLSKVTNEVKICFEQTAAYFPNKKCNLVNYPVRFTTSNLYDKEKIIASIGLEQGKKTIFILGGSQGSKFINSIIKDFINKNPNIKNLQVIHQTGNDEFNWQEFYKLHNIPAVIFSFNKNVENLYFIADLIISRSGAGTLAEIIFFSKKCITIPLETSYTSHQILNALALQKKYPELVHVIKQTPDTNVYFDKIKEIIS